MPEEGHQHRGDARTCKGRRRWALNFLADLVKELEGEKKAGSRIAPNVKVVKSWLSHNGVDVKGRLRIRGAHNFGSNNGLLTRLREGRIRRRRLGP